MEKLSELIADHWHSLPIAAKKRFLRHGRTWYDVHRFRLPPQIETRIEAAESRGQIHFLSASILDAKPNGERLDISTRKRGTHEIETKSYDAVINCTGLEDRPEYTTNPFLRALVSQGLAVTHPTCSGFDVDFLSNAIDKTGRPNPDLFVVGPLTYGAFADQQGSVFIARRLMRIVPNILRQVAAN
jgi:uncharacterized NAD(P)/FAD-binding protein YdhS